MTVTSIKDAWAEVQKMFLTDYGHDTGRSNRAGYPIIYYSTAASVEQKIQRGGVEVTHDQSCKWAKSGPRPDELKKLAQTFLRAEPLQKLSTRPPGQTVLL